MKLLIQLVREIYICQEEVRELLLLWQPCMFEIDGNFICSFEAHVKLAVCRYNCEWAKMWRHRVYLLLPVVHVSKFAVRTLFSLSLGVNSGR